MMTNPKQQASGKPEAQASHAAMLAAYRAAGGDIERVSLAEIVATFIDVAKVEEAGERHRQAVARRADADKALHEANRAYAAAQERKRRAIGGESDECPIECTAAERASAAIVDVREQVRAAAENAVAAADRGIEEARAVAHRPVAIEAFRRRVLAVAAMEKARALGEVAEGDWKLANALIAQIRATGTGYPLAGASDHAGLPLASWTLADELARWDGTPHRPAWWDNDVRAFLAEKG